MANRVYVILHGLISLVEDTRTRQFTALLIDMPDHRVAAGHWLTETTIPKGARLELTNVERDKKVLVEAKLEPAKNIVYPSSGQGIDQAKWNQYRYAEILLPQPTKITSLNFTDVSTALIPPAPARTKFISDTQVFEYDVVAPTLGDPTPFPILGFGPFTFFQGTLAPVSTIHILNEPEADADDEHVKEEFKRSAEIFRSPLRLNTGGTVLDLSGADALLPDVLHEEALPLSRREFRVFEMAGEARKRPEGTYKTQKGFGVGGSFVCSGGHGFNP